MGKKKKNLLYYYSGDSESIGNTKRSVRTIKKRPTIGAKETYCY